MKLKNEFICGLVVVLAGIMIMMLVHEGVHVVQLSLMQDVQPTSLCLDFGSASGMHVQYRGTIEDTERLNMEIQAYIIGFVALILFVIFFNKKFDISERR